MKGERSRTAGDGERVLPSVCVVGPLPPPSGGMAVQCEELVRLLRQDGVDVELVRNNAPCVPAWVGRIPILRAGFRLIPYLMRLWRAAGRRDLVHVLANSGWGWHLFAAPAVWVARLRDRPVIVHYHGGNAEAFFSRAPSNVLVSLRMAHARVTPSAFLARAFEKFGLDVTIVPNIIDLDRFQINPSRGFGDAPHLIVTRNLEPIYDIATAIRAFAIVRHTFPAARLTIAGSGPDLERLQELVAEAGLQDCVAFPGRIDNIHIPALYASADCMLNPSTVDNMPISILEALACGVPVVSTNAGGIPDIVESGKSAMLVDVGDAESMAANAVHVLGDLRMREQMRAEGVRIVSSYAWPNVRNRWLELYQGLTSHFADSRATERLDA